MNNELNKLALFELRSECASLADQIEQGELSRDVSPNPNLNSRREDEYADAERQIIERLRIIASKPPSIKSSELVNRLHNLEILIGKSCKGHHCDFLNQIESGTMYEWLKELKSIREDIISCVGPILKIASTIDQIVEEDLDDEGIWADIHADALREWSTQLRSSVWEK